MDAKNKLGFIFELGFNIGILAFLKNKRNEGKAAISDSILVFFKNVLNNIDNSKEQIYMNYTKGIVDEKTKEIIKKNIDYLLFKGIICGKNFCREFIENKVKDSEFKVEYFQACFYNLFREEILKDYEKEYFKTIVQQQLSINISIDEINNLLAKGEAFRADSILLISVRNKFHLCIVDNAISTRNVMNFSNINELKEIYKRTIYNKRKKSSFSNLSLDTKGIRELNIDRSLCDYIIALYKKDKPIFKMIQAGSYGYSFISFLKNKKHIKEDTLESVCIVGYTDEEISSINISKKDIELFHSLNKTYEALKQFNVSYKSVDRNNENTNFETKIHDVFARIRTNFKSFFNINRDEFKDIFDIDSGLTKRIISETLDNYQNTSANYNYNNKTIKFRDAHAEEISKYIRSKEYKLLFLTGNPGIGKTTSIVEYLKNQDSYIFIYLSPRTQVNKDIEQKFLSCNKESLYDNDAIYLTCNSNDETRIGSKKVDIVNFTSNVKEKYEKIESPIKFMDSKRERNFSEKSINYKNNTKREMVLEDNKNMGVLKRLTSAIEYLIKEKLNNKIIATAAVQSLKLVGKDNTAKHFEKIFNSIYNERTSKVIKDSFKDFSNNYKNIIFMVDEITGDESGVEFLHELMKIVFTNIHDKLTDEEKEKINFKIIVADASITDSEVIEKHLNEKENDNDKIYYKFEHKQDENTLESKPIMFKNKYKSIYINTNSYPAKRLNIEYKLYLDLKEVSEKDKIINNDLIKKVNTSIAEEVIDLILNNESEHVIVYVQNISKIEDIKDSMVNYYNQKTGKEFKKYENYIIINSTNSEEERKNVFKYKDIVKVVLMTSSASRGISFPKVTTFFVDMPKFDIEKNIMEILQLIYRGRGNDKIDTECDKFIKFYINDTTYYRDKDNEKDIAIKEAAISIMTLMILLKSSILTRINGYANLGENHIVLVPIGGKSISTNDDMVIEAFSSLIKNLRKEIIKDQSNIKLKKILEDLMYVFKSTKLETSQSIYKLSLRDIVKNFNDTWSEGLFNLVNFDPFYDAYIIGDIAIFKINSEIKNSLQLVPNIVEDTEKSKILNRLSYMIENDNLHDTLRNEMQKVRCALDHFKSYYQGNSMILADKSHDNDRFVAIPLIYPFMLKEFDEYNTEKIDEEESFRDILESYLKCFYYNLGNCLPITGDYEGVPYIAFKSGSLLNLRKKIFSDKYIFCSSEVNLLNLLLFN